MSNAHCKKANQADLVRGDLDGSLVHRVDETQAANDLVLHAERHLNLVLAALIARQNFFPFAVQITHPPSA